jgi:hypothetical protein
MNHSNQPVKINADRIAGENQQITPLQDVFDPSKAHGPTLRLFVAEIIDLLQVTHAEDRIAEYAAAMRHGYLFPPIGVFRLGRRWLLTDGHKRLAAYRQLDQPEILVECWSLEILFADLCRQSHKSHQRLLAALANLPSNPRPILELLGHTLAHWWRIVRSLAGLMTGARQND